MNLILIYAFIAAILGLLPIGGSVLLLMLEGAMFYHICMRYGVPVLHEGFKFVGAVIGIAFLFKAAAEALHFVPIAGQCANSIIAFGVVFGLGKVVENYAQSHATKTADKNAMRVDLPISNETLQDAKQFAADTLNKKAQIGKPPAEPIQSARATDSSQMIAPPALSKISCSACSTPNEATARFCLSCGSALVYDSPL